ncbi:hypothetical protein G9444_3472 [Rhodococcus erythropolis]|uniref:Uncharacterized protein n=1 Tax=Rhodococcus erythropolis TaxID=1833 RepID=A0A6G9CVJ1_RHOER|nr:hypothetical protein G9444_3472 [Rhodococcus erythropolis]
MVGTRLPASTNDASRGALPVASRAPPPIWTAALILTSVSGSAGTFCVTAPGSVSTDLSISGDALAAR